VITHIVNYDIGFSSKGTPTLTRAAKRATALNRYARIRYDVCSRAGRLNMYRPDGALIVHLRRICMRASVRTDRSTRRRNSVPRAKAAHSERRRLAAIYTDGWSARYRKSVSLRASFSRVTIFSRVTLSRNEGNLIRLSSGTRITCKRETRGGGCVQVRGIMTGSLKSGGCSPRLFDYQRNCR